MRGRCTYHIAKDCQEIEFPASERFHLEREKITVHSMMKLPSSTPTLTVATRMTKRKGENALSREHEYLPPDESKSIRVLFVTFELLVGPLWDLLLWMNWCVSASCGCCMLLVYLVACVLRLFVVISLIQRSLCTLGV